MSEQNISPLSRPDILLTANHPNGNRKSGNEALGPDRRSIVKDQDFVHRLGGKTLQAACEQLPFIVIRDQNTDVGRHVYAHYSNPPMCYLKAYLRWVLVSRLRNGFKNHEAIRPDGEARRCRCTARTPKEAQRSEPG